MLDSVFDLLLLTYDANGNMLTWTDAAGDTVTYAYDTLNRVETVTDAAGATSTFTYQGNERTPTTVAAPDGAVTTNVVTAGGLLSSTADADGVTTTYTYDSNRNLLTATDAAGGVTAYAYDAVGRLLSTTTPLGNVTATTYDDTGRVLTRTDATGAVWSFTYDGAGNLETLTEPATQTAPPIGPPPTSTPTPTPTAAPTPTPTAGPTPTPTPTPGGGGGGALNVLFVVTDATYPTQIELDIETKLEDAVNGNGHTVTLASPSDPELTTATSSYDVVYLSPWVDDATLGTKYDGVGADSLPVLHTKFDLFDEAGFITGTSSPNWTSTGDVYYEPDAGFPFAWSGQTAENTVTWTTEPEFWHYITSSQLGSGAATMLVTGNNVDEVVGFTYDNGALLADGTTTADARIYGFGWANPGSLDDSLNTAGTQLIEDILAWLANTSSNPPPTPTPTPTAGPTATPTPTAAPTPTPTAGPTPTPTPTPGGGGGATPPPPPAGGSAVAAVWTYTYDVMGRVETLTGPQANVTTWVYGSAGDLVQVQTPGSAVAVVTPGDMLRNAGIADATGVGRSYGYDGEGQLTSVTDDSGATAQMVYDEMGRLTSRTDGAGVTTGYAYDAAGRVAQVTSPDGVFAYTRDLQGRVLTATGPDGGVVTRAYTPAGRLATMTDQRSNVTAYGYDTVGRAATVTNANGGVTTYGYDADSRVVTVTSPDANVTTYGYDAAGRQTSVTDPTGGAWFTGYNARGDIATRTDPAGATTAFFWDPVGNLSAVFDANANPTSYGYDGRNNRVSRTDAAGNVWSWTYDDADRVVAETDPDANTKTWTYDTQGRTATMGDGSGRSEAYVYDAAGRLGSITYGDGSVTSWTYDASGRRATMADAIGTTSYGWDELGRLESVVRPGGDTTSLTYDAAGNRVSMTYPDASTVTYGYDNLNRLATVTSAAVGTVTYGYDADSVLVSEDLPGAGSDRVWSRDSVGRVVSYSEGTASSTVTRDAVGRVATIAGSETAAFTYDWAGQLTGSVDGSGSRLFGFDSVANVSSVTVDGAATAIGVAANGEIVDVAGVGAVYDGAGRATSLPLPDGTMIGTVFDARGLPVTVTTTPATGPAVVETRVYDGDRRLAAVTIDDGAGSGPETYDFVWDISTAVPQIVSWNTSAGSSEFVYGASRVAVIDPTGTAAVFSQSALGDTVSSAATAGYADPGPVGPYGETAASPAPRFGYRGELVLGEQTHLRARDLVNDLGRFATTDPLDGVDGSATVSNRYQYGDNTPPNARDPLGLRPELDAFLREVLAANDYNNRLRNDLSLIGATAFLAVDDVLYYIGSGQAAWDIATGVDPVEFSPYIDCGRVALGDDGLLTNVSCLIDLGTAGYGPSLGALADAFRGLDALKLGDEAAQAAAAALHAAPNPSKAVDEILTGLRTPNGLRARATELLGPSDNVIVLGRQQDTAVASAWPGHSVLDAPDWSPDLNDAFIDELITQQRTVYLGSPIEGNLIQTTGDFAGQPTIFARELEMLDAAGYTRFGDYLVPPR